MFEKELRVSAKVDTSKEQQEEALISQVSEQLKEVIPKKKGLPKDLPHKAAEVAVQAIMKQRSLIPLPQELADYNTVCPGAADRILTMAENQQRNDHEINKFIHKDE